MRTRSRPQVVGLQKALEDVYVSKIGHEQLELLQQQLSAQQALMAERQQAAQRQAEQAAVAMEAMQRQAQVHERGCEWA